MVRHLVGVAVAAVFLLLTSRRLDWEVVREILTSISIAPLLTAVCVLGVDFLMRVLRWWSMLRAFDPRLPFRNCIGPFLAGFAVNNVFPFRAGDLFRAMGFRAQLRVSVMRVFGTVIVERILDVWVLFVFLLVGLTNLSPGAVPSALIRGAVFLSVLCLLAPLLLIAGTHGLREIASKATRSSRKPPWPVGHLSNWLGQVMEVLTALRSPALLSRLFALSVVIWVLEGSVFAIVAWTLSVEAGIFGPWFALATGTLATALPSTPGHVGTFDYFAALGLAAYGATREAAVVFSLVVHLLLWMPITVVGGLYLAAPRGRELWWRVRAAKSGKRAHSHEPPLRVPLNPS